MTAEPTMQPETVLPATTGRPDDEAVRFGESALTWSELEMRSLRFACALRDAGVEADGTWAILARNCLQWAEVCIGNGRVGSRYVPLNWHLTVAELHELLVDSGATLFVVGDGLEDAARSAAHDTKVERVVVLGEEYERWIADQQVTPIPDGPLGVPLQYTGGTTGRSKGVIRPALSVRASELAAGYARWGTLTGMPADDHMMLCTPAYHALGGAVLRTALVRGNRVDIIDRWDPEVVLDTIVDREIAGTAMVPTQFIRLLKMDPQVRTRFDLSSLQWVLHTAAPCPPWAKRGMIEWFGPVIVELYGSSEGVGPVIATSREWLERPGTVGKATAALELSIVDDAGDDLPPGEIGTIYGHLRDGAPEYYGDPDKTASMKLPDGRFTVGDVGWLDEDGYLFLADRRVDLIIVGGSNIYPAEVEAAMSQHPDVGDVAVFGIPDPEWGQQVKAVVEPLAGADIDLDDLRAFTTQRLAAFKMPASIDVVESLPREASGKLKKHRLRAPYWENVSPESS